MAGKDMQKVPKLRVRGFADDWEKRILAREVSFSKGSGYSKADIVNEGLPLVLYGRLYTDYEAEITDVDTFASEKKGTVFSKGNEVIVPASGETAEDIARASAVKMKGCMLGGDLNILVPKSNIDSTFLAISISHGAPSKKLASMAQGKSVVHIHNSDIEQLEIPFPEYAEQVKIVSVLRHLDSLAALHQRKLSKLQDLKNALLVKMFTAEGESVPAVRFKGYEGAWEQRSWKDCVDISTNMVDPTSCEFNDLPHIGPGNIESFTGQLMNNIHTAAEDGVISGKFLFQPGDIIYGKIRPNLGKYVLVDFKGLASADSYVLDAKNHLNQSFLYLVIQTGDFYQYTVTMSMRSGMPKVNREQLNEYYFNAPSTDVQKKIGNLIEKVRFLITLHQRKLSKLKDIKKALLNNMFPGGDI